MRCSHCSSLMSEVETQVDERIEQSFFECSFCGRSQLLTRRMVTARQLQESSANSLLFRNRELVEKYSF